MGQLEETDIQEHLKALKGWEWSGQTIVKKMKFKDFQEAMTYVIRVSYLAELADHHPDMEISYSRVTLRLSTHSAGGLTEKDFQLAGQIDQISEGKMT